MRISILIPTRNRSDRLLKFLASLDEYSSKKHEVEVVLGIDDDDIETQDLKLVYANIHVTKTVAPRASMGALNTRCLHASTGDIVMLGRAIDHQVEMMAGVGDHQVVQYAAILGEQSS